MLSPEEISSRQFLISLRGFDRDEVKRFLDDVAQQHAELRSRVRELEEQVQAARAEGPTGAHRGHEGAEPAPKSQREAFQALGEETTRILVAAEESADEIRQRATDAANSEMEQARRDAREEVDGARRTANKIVADAERRRDEIAEETRQLEATRDRFLDDLRDAMRSVQSAARGMSTPGADELADDVDGAEPEEPGAAEERVSDDDAIRRAVAPVGPPQEGDEILADLDHLDPDETTEIAIREDADDVAAVGAAVAASASTDEDDVDGALDTASRTASDGADEAEPEPTSAAGTTEPETASTEPAPDPIALRSDALAEVRPSMLRRLKRGLQDVQNGVLDAIRRHADDGGGVEQLLPEDDDLSQLGGVAGVFLTAAYQAGVTDGAAMVGAEPSDVAGDRSRVPATAATFRAVLGHEITSSLAATLRAGLEAGEPETSLSERVGEVFRDLKGPVIEAVADEQLVRVYGYGVVDAWDGFGASASKAWVVGEEPRCPANQCRANANEGAIALRDAFPSGEQVPPAHDACTCALAPG